MPSFASVKVTLRFLVQSAEEAEAIVAALAPDDETAPCSKVATRREGNEVVVEIECKCSSPVACARSLADDVVRVIGSVLGAGPRR